MTIRYEYEIEVTKIDPLSNGIKFAAKANYVFKVTESNSTRVYPDVGDRYGKTEMEAYQNALKATEEWIAQQPKK